MLDSNLKRDIFVHEIDEFPAFTEILIILRFQGHMLRGQAHREAYIVFVEFLIGILLYEVLCYGNQRQQKVSIILCLILLIRRAAVIERIILPHVAHRLSLDSRFSRTVTNKTSGKRLTARRLHCLVSGIYSNNLHKKSSERVAI